MPEQPAGVPMGDDMCFFVINKGVQRQEFLTILSCVKKDRREVPVNICVSTHTKRREETSLILTLLKLVADLGQGQPAAAHLRQKNRFEWKMNLGKLDN